jgi:hypothetical protein
MLERSHIAVVISFSLLLFWLGRLSLQYQLQQESPITQIKNVNPGIPLVNIMNIEGETLIGYASEPKTRIKSGKELAVPDEDGRFELNLKHLGYLPRTDVIIHHIPEGAKYVASKNGKNFYEITSGSGKRISVANRVYFNTLSEAKAAGYKAGSGVK